MSDKKQVILLNPEDSVAVAVREIQPGEETTLEGLVCKETIPAGHKVTVKNVAAGEILKKYGQHIGVASQAIEAGCHVHVHNLKMQNLDRVDSAGEGARPTQYVPEGERATFEGFIRPGGRVGTRNYIGVMATCNCSASVARFIARAFDDDEMKAYPNVDGVAAFVHEAGCCQTPQGEGMVYQQRVFGGYARNPNLAGIVLVTLGCEVNRAEFLMASQGLEAGPDFRVVDIQKEGGTRKAVAKGVNEVRELLAKAGRCHRTIVSAEHLVLALECGGSDAYSGLTANPVMGAVADRLVRHGGTVILGETPEIYGAEHLLARRAVSGEVRRKLLDRIKWWENYTTSLNAEINNNPAPGNKDGGLTTIYEKSLGAIHKSGSTNLVDVYQFAEQVTAKGLVFMDTPGYDPVSVTGMIAGGASLVCFTTGRGTVWGTKPSPTLKLATNTAMYDRMKDDMDVNCGLVADGLEDIESLGGKVFNLLLETASGKKTKSEELGFGCEEFVPWHLGAQL